MRYIISLLLLLFSVVSARAEGLVIGSGPSGCSGSPFITQETVVAAANVGSSTDNYYAGIWNSSATPLVICSLSIRARENGNLSGSTLYIEKWSGNSSGNLGSKTSDIMSMNGSVFPYPIDYYNIAFPSPVTLSQYDILVFTFNATPGATNYLTIAFATSNLISNQAFFTYTSAKAQNLGGTGSDITGYFYGNN
jgi:hypothetical protein